MSRNIISLLFIVFGCFASVGQTAPSNADAKRAWDIAQMYLEEDSPELAVTELKKVVCNEDFAPAYIKLIELCYKIGDVKHVDIAEEYSNNFMSLWPDRTDEIKDIIAMGEARGKLRKKKFYESLIGDWHRPGDKMAESYFSFKIRKNENGGVYAIIPKQMWDYDWVTEWQDGKFMQWEGDNGVYLCEAQYATFDGYRVKVNMASGSTFWEYVYLYIPFDQPAISDGKIKATVSIKTSGPNNYHWSKNLGEIDFVKD